MMTGAEEQHMDSQDTGAPQFASGRSGRTGSELTPTTPAADPAGNAESKSLTIMAPCKPSRELLFAHLPASAHAERMRQLRTELMLRHAPGRAECLSLAVISPAAGEGRSVLAAELALAFSQLGKRTLLIDADMRRPRQHQLFEVGQRDGLQQLISRFDPKMILRVDGFPALHVVTAGEPGEQNPSELLSDGRFDAIIRKFRELFDYIIVDSPEFSEYTDARVISTVIGSVLTVSRSGKTSMRASRDMLTQLKPSGARILGGVINGG